MPGPVHGYSSIHARGNIHGCARGNAYSYAHLHVRSGFSYGYGVAYPAELARRAAELGMNALAITDQDTLAGVPRMMMACAGEDVSPIVGAEISMEINGEPAGHLVLLAQSLAGYRSLCRLITDYRCFSSYAYEDRREPLCSVETLLEHSRELVCLTGAITQGTLPRLLLGGRAKKVEDLAGLLLEAFGAEGLYIELTDDRTAGSRRRIARVESFAREHSLPVLATKRSCLPEGRGSSPARRRRGRG